MKINITKTKVLVYTIARDLKIKADVYIDNQQLQQINEMVYRYPSLEGAKSHKKKTCKNYERINNA